MPSPREAAGLVEAAADADGGGVGEGRGAGLVADGAKKLLRLKASIFFREHDVYIESSGL